MSSSSSPSPSSSPSSSLPTLSLEQLATATGGWHHQHYHRANGAGQPTQFTGGSPIGSTEPPSTAPSGTPILPANLGGATTPNGRTASSYRRSFNL